MIAVAFTACKDTGKNGESVNSMTDQEAEMDMSQYPDDLQKVLAAHGGLDKWNQMQSLTFRMPSDNGDEVHTVDLKSRKTLIETDKYDIGFDGEKLWLKQDTTFFQPSQVEFYYNLMFYFYAMPFVLADDGIVYSDADPLEMNGVNYPGIKISYNDGIGNSSNDEYVLYMDPSTKKMAWLGYTVTYGSYEKSDRMSYIHYNKWKVVNGLLLPEELTWYTVEDGNPTEARGPARKFTKVDIDAATMDNTMYEKPETGAYVDQEQE